MGRVSERFYQLVSERGVSRDMAPRRTVCQLQRVDYTTLGRMQIANTASAIDRALFVYVGVPVGGRLLATQSICGSEQLQRTTV